MCQVRLRATAFFRGLCSNEVAVALAIVERLPHGVEREVVFGRGCLRRKGVCVNHVDELAGREAPPFERELATP